MPVKVSQYRDQIDTVHFWMRSLTSAVAGRDNLISEISTVSRAAIELMEMKCSRATAADRLRAERAIDQATDLVTRRRADVERIAP